jgi:hypothetical protein
VSDIEFVGVEDLKRRIAREPDAFAYWLKHYVRNHFPEIARLARRAARKARPASDAVAYERSKAAVARR